MTRALQHRYRRWNPTLILSVLLLIATSQSPQSTCADDQDPKAAGAPAKTAAASSPLDLSQATKKLEVRVSQIGYRDTLLFYTFEPQRIIVKLQIGNKDKKFPMSGTIYAFGADATLEGMEKWLNNQHSDALFPIVANPVASHPIPAEFATVTEHKFVAQENLGLGAYDTYDVKFVLKDFAEKSGIKIKGFTSSTKVHIPTK